MQRDNAACLEAIERFVDQAMVPLVFQGITSMKQQADQIAEENNNVVDKETILKELLLEVKSWTQVLLEEETRRIEAKVSFLQKLLTALFIMKVKVLSCLNMRKNTEEFPLTIPSNTTYVHQVYIHACRTLAEDLKWSNSINYVEMEPSIRQALRCAEFDCLRWNELLEWGLADVNPNEVLKNMADDNVIPTEPETPGNEHENPSLGGDESELDSLANDEKRRIGSEDEDNDSEKDDDESPSFIQDDDDDKKEESNESKPINSDEGDELEEKSNDGDDRSDPGSDEEPASRPTSPSFF